MKKPFLAVSLLWAAAILATAILIDSQKESAVIISYLSGAGVMCMALFSKPCCRRQ